jgi:predicted nucleic-acid-binding protein
MVHKHTHTSTLRTQLFQELDKEGRMWASHSALENEVYVGERMQKFAKKPPL